MVYSAFTAIKIPNQAKYSKVVFNIYMMMCKYAKFMCEPICSCKS